MKYTAHSESWVASIAPGKAECYICHETLSKSCMLSYKVAVFYCILHLKMCKQKTLLWNLTHLLNKQIDFFDKNVSIVLLLYNYTLVTLAFYNYTTTVL